MPTISQWLASRPSLGAAETVRAKKARARQYLKDVADPIVGRLEEEWATAQWTKQVDRTAVALVDALPYVSSFRTARAWSQLRLQGRLTTRGGTDR